MKKSEFSPDTLESSECFSGISYSPPKATFVPLKLEERLMACEKAPGENPGDPQDCVGNTQPGAAPNKT